MKTINYYDVMLLVETPVTGSERTHTVNLAIEMDSHGAVDFNRLAKTALTLYNGEGQARVAEIKEKVFGVHLADSTEEEDFVELERLNNEIGDNIKFEADINDIIEGDMEGTE